MTKWRKKTGSSGVEELLKETIQTAIRMKAVKPQEFQNLNVDTTVQEKAISHPTDAKLYNRMRSKLVTLAKSRGVKLRQSYVRVSRQAMVKASRYFHARQHRRAKRQVRKLKTYLGRVSRDIRRKIAGNSELEQEFAELLMLADKLLAQKRTDKNKLYSIHAPEVECIAKGKAHKKYEFGNKVSVVATSRKGLVIGVKSFHGNPYDGHTLRASMKQAEQLSGQKLNGDVFVDLGYRGHNYQGEASIHISRTKRLVGRLKRLMKRRNAIEAKIGQLKNHSRMDRNFLLGEEGDRINAILCGCAMNLQFLIGVIYQRLCFLLFSVLRPWLSGSGYLFRAPQAYFLPSNQQITLATTRF
jgi:IS5 family transposase